MKQKFRSAFTLLELLLVLAAIASVTAGGYFAVVSMQSSAEKTKLEQDVQALNRAVNMYQVSGGKLPEGLDEEGVLDQLRLVAADPKRVAGLKGSMIDPRLAARRQTDQEALGKGARAYWNGEKRQFEVTTTGAAPGVKEFYLGALKVPALPYVAADGTLIKPGTDDRKTVFQFADDDKWVWDYAKAEATPPTGPVRQPVGDGDVPGSEPGGGRETTELAPPEYSLGEGRYELEKFPLNLKLTLPAGASATSAAVYYLIPGAGWSRYTGEIEVDPGTVVAARTVSLDPDNFSDSPERSQKYRTQPALLELEARFPRDSYTYAELGGPMVKGNSATAEPGTLRLTGPLQVNPKYLNSTNIEIAWTTDGSDPAISPTRRTAGDFRGGAPAVSLPLNIRDFQAQGGPQVRAVALTRNPELFQDSSGSDTRLSIAKTTLGAASITYDGKAVTMAPASQENLPANARIFYTANGEDPGDNGAGDPASKQAQLYKDPVKPEGDLVQFSGRLYPPEEYKAWFDPGSTGYAGVSNPAAGNFYATSAGENRIYQFDALTGRNIILTAGCPFPPATVAYLGGQQGSVYYLEQAVFNWRLGSYSPASGAHRDLGSLTSTQFSYQPGSRPSNMTAFNGSLFYVPDGTDDLVRIDLAKDGSILDQYKMADITYDAAVFEKIGDIAVTPQGMLYISAANAWAAFDVSTLAPVKVVPGPAPWIWAGLLANGSGGLLGVRDSEPDKLYKVDPVTGAGTVVTGFSPQRKFDDFGSPAGDIPLQLPPGHYAISPGRENVYRVDLETGRNYILRTGLGFVPGAAAYQPGTGRIFLTSTGTLQLWQFDPSDNSLTEITGMTAPGLAWKGTASPASLAWYNGALYYPEPGSDALIRVTLNGTTVATRAKVANLLDGGTGGAAGLLDGMTIGPDGVCYFANSDQDRLAYYDLGNLGGFTPVTTRAPAKFRTITFSAGGVMHGVRADSGETTKLYTVNTETGEASFRTALQPAVEFSDITGLNDSQPSGINTNSYFVDGISPRIYRLDAETGGNRILTGAAPWPPGTLAYDQENQILYYTRAGSSELACYSLSSNTHTVLTPLNDPSLGYIPASPPENLTFFNGGLYYVAPATDDLVRLEIVNNQVRAAWKEADLARNATTAGDPQDIAVDSTGKLYLSGTAFSARFDLVTGSGWTILRQPAGDVFQGLLTAAGGAGFQGGTAAAPRRISTFSPVTGLAGAGPVTDPQRIVRDAASAQQRVSITPPSGVYYATVSGQPVIYRVNPGTGAMETASASCPAAPEAIAYDPESKAVYYTATTAGSGITATVTLHKYDPAQQRHSVVGSLSAAGLASRPTGTLEALTFFCGDLYYVNPGTDDLIRVQLGASGIASADKAADLTGNTKTLGTIGALAVSNNGTLYLSRLDAPLLAKLNFYTRTGYTELNTTTARLTAMVLDGGNTLYGAATGTPAVLETVSAANGQRTFKANTSPSLALRDISGLNDAPQPELPEAYAISGGNRHIYRFDPATGVTFAVTRNAPFNPGALARDPAANILYYVEETGIPWRIGRYDIAAKTHSILATAGSSGNSYNAAVRPSNLYFYDGHLYFLANNTDDLVQIRLGTGGNSVVSIAKAADLLDNAGTFGVIGDAAADATGAVLFSDSTGRLRTFNMKVLTGVQVLATGLPDYQALILTAGGGFYGAQSSSPASVYALNRSTGAATLTAPSFPTVSFSDMAGHEVSSPWLASDSLWAIGRGSNALGEFQNWNLPNVTARVWPNLSYTSGAGGAVTAFPGGNDLDGMTVTSAGTAYILCNRTVTVDGITCRRSLFSLNLGTVSGTSANTAPVLTFVGAFDRTLSGYVLTGSDHRLTGLALGADGLLYAVLNVPNAANQLLRLNSLATDAARQFNNISLMGPLTGTGETVTDGSGLTAAPDGTLYVTDNADDKVSAVNPSSAALTSVYSSDTPVSYKGLTVHPGSGEVVAANTATDFIRRVRPGSGNDTDRFNTRTVSGSALTDTGAIAFPSGNLQNPGDPAPPYFAADLSTTLYRVNPVNGRTVVLTSSAPFTVNCVAYHADAGLLYYLEDSDSSIRLGVYNISANTHTVMGDLRNYGAYRPVSRPQDLVWYAGSLYYFNPGGATLVRVRLDAAGTALAAQELAATVTTGAAWTVTGAAVDGNGQLYFAAGTGLYRYNLATLSGFTTLSATAGSWASLLFTAGPAGLYGTAAASPARIDALNAATAAVAAGAATTPSRSFSSMTGPGNGVLPPDSPYYAASRTNKIHTLDPVTGVATVLPVTAPAQIDTIALNESAGLLYCLTNTDSSTQLGCYSIASGTFTTIGQLMDNAATGLTVDLRPYNLVSFQNDLYYIRRSSTAAEKDDLIRVTLNAAGTAIASQEKIADLNGNGDWGVVSGASLDDDGWLYFNTGNQLRKYNLRTQTGAAIVGTVSSAQQSLLWHRSRDLLYGSRSSALTQVNSLSPDNAATGTPVTNSLNVQFHSLASGNRALPAPSLTAPPAYIVGDFSRSGGDFNDVARLNSDGSLDTSFNVGSGTNAGSIVRTAARAADGKLLIGGNFTSFNGTSRAALARLTASGSLDTSFAPVIEGASAATTFSLDWSTLGITQGAAASGGDTVNASSSTSDATHGLSASGGFTGFGSQTFSNVGGSGIDVTMHYSANMTGGPSLHGPSGSGYAAGENPDRRVTGPVVLRFTNDRTAPYTPATLGFSFSEPVYFERVLAGSISTVGGHAENAFIRAWDGADATGSLVAASSFTNFSGENGPLYGTASDPVTANALANVLTATPASARYLAVGAGKEEENRYGRVSLAWTGTPVRSLAVSHWTTQTTTTSSGGGSYDPAKPFGAAQDFSMFSYGNFEIAGGGAGAKGGVAVGGNMTYGYNGGFYLDGMAGKDSLVVEGVLNTNGNGSVSSGNVVYGSSPDPGKIYAWGGTKRQATGVIPFASIKASHLSLSSQWKALANTPGSTISYTPAGGDGKVPVTLNAASLTGLVVFNLDPSKLVSIANWNINNVSSTATILINIPGTSPPTLQNTSISVNGSGDPQKRVIFHYPDAAVAGFGSIAIPGTVFAPKGLVTMNSSGGQLLGQVIAERIELRSTWNGGQYMFSGTGLPGPAGTPATTTSVSGGNGALTLALSGFRRTTGLPGAVWAVKTQSDGRIVIGGRFTSVNGVARKNIARLNADGTLDTTFDPGTGPNGDVCSLALLSDGSVMAGGEFTTWNGTTAGAKVALLSSNGVRNTAFSSTVSTAAADVVRWIQQDSSGNVLIGGRFTSPANGLARITLAGALDSGFAVGSGAAGGPVNTGVVQSDGSVLVAGDFTTVNGVARSRIARLSASGALTAAWNPDTGFDGLVNALLQLPGSGFAHAGGQFSSFRGVTRNKVSVLETENAAAGVSPWGPSTLGITAVYDVE